MNDDVLTTPEVAAIFKVSTRTVTQWANTGKLASFRTPGGNHRFRRADVEAFAATVTPAP